MKLSEPYKKTLRVVTIDGHRTSVRMERAYWATIDELCAAGGMSLKELCLRLGAGGRNLTAALRLAAFMYGTRGEMPEGWYGEGLGARPRRLRRYDLDEPDAAADRPKS